MKLKILVAILIWYSCIILFFIFAHQQGILNDYSTNADLTGFGDIVTTILQFIGFVGFGIIISSQVPLWFTIVIGVIQSCITIFVIGFILSP